MALMQTARDTRRRYVKKSGRRLLQAIDRYLGSRSLIGDRPFFDPQQFSYLRALEDHWGAIRSELDRLLEVREHIPSFHQVSPDQRRISTGNDWKTFILFGFGRKAERNCRLCPQTTRVLERLPDLQNAWFSILSPGYHIPPHRGVTKGLLRIHLGLLIPREKERCYIRVADETRYWEEGSCLVFDDTFDHEVWNNTEEQRVVLFIDVERPLPPFARVVNKGILRAIQWTAYVKDARKNLADWEQRFEAAVRNADAFTVDSDEAGKRPTPGVSERRRAGRASRAVPSRK